MDSSENMENFSKSLDKVTEKFKNLESEVESKDAEVCERIREN